MHENHTKSRQDEIAVQINVAGKAVDSREARVSVEQEVPTWLQESCVICMESWVAGEVVVILPCMHRLHKPCAERWVQTD